MKQKKLILKKESFGGIFVDNTIEGFTFLKPEDYKKKEKELMEYVGEYATKIVDVTQLGYPLLINAASSPNNIFWEITKNCKAALCTGCFMDSNSPKWPKNQTSLKEKEKIIKQFSDLGGNYVRLSGGEPTDEEEFFDIADLLSDEGITIGLNTNGLFNDKKLEAILSCDIKDIRISLDGPKNINDAIRGKGNYEKAIQTIADIANYNAQNILPVKLTINFVLMKKNIDYIENMIEIAQTYNSKISFGLLRLSGRADTKEMLSPAQVVQAAYRVHKMRENLHLPKDMIRINYDIFCDELTNNTENRKDKKVLSDIQKNKTSTKFFPYPFDNSKCPLGSSGFALDAYAHIVPCGYLVNSKEWIGETITDKNMLEVWQNSAVLNTARNITRNGCTDCGHHKTSCNGGCPAMSYFINNNANGQDPYCIRNVDIKSVKSIEKN